MNSLQQPIYSSRNDFVACCSARDLSTSRLKIILLLQISSEYARFLVHICDLVLFRLVNEDGGYLRSCKSPKSIVYMCCLPFWEFFIRTGLESVGARMLRASISKKIPVLSGL